MTEVDNLIMRVAELERAVAKINQDYIDLQQEVTTHCDAIDKLYNRTNKHQGMIEIMVTAFEQEGRK